jgi:hypothetical protein
MLKFQVSEDQQWMILLESLDEVEKKQIEISLTKKICKHFEKIVNYFFLYPTGHFGVVPETFLTNLPFVQVIAIFLATAAAGLAATTSLTSLTSGAGGSFLTSPAPVLCEVAEDV